MKLFLPVLTLMIVALACSFNAAPRQSAATVAPTIALNGAGEAQPTAIVTNTFPPKNTEPATATNVAPVTAATATTLVKAAALNSPTAVAVAQAQAGTATPTVTPVLTSTATATATTAANTAATVAINTAATIVATPVTTATATRPAVGTATPTVPVTATPNAATVVARSTTTATPTTGQQATPGTTQGNGPEVVTGKVTYTNTFFTAGVAQPIVILEDQTGFVTRNRKFVFPVASQVIGSITSDFFTSPFSYSINLPIEPAGGLHDVNHDNKKDTGVMVYAVAYWTNTWGDPYLERRDQGGGGWSTAYASTRVSASSENYREVVGGKYLVYAPDDKQQFPSGFGTDKKLFTNDDPIMALPAGWSVIDLDKNPFTIDRSEKPVVDLIEPTEVALDDFSKLSYTEAFDKMLDKFTKEYAFTDLKKIDWAAMGKQFRPLFEQAQAANDEHAYALALRDFIWSIPDTHVGFDQSLLQEDFSTATAGGLGFAMRETDDGKIIANFVLPGGPAEKAGMKWGAQILTLDGKPVAQVVDATLPWSSPFSNPLIKRLQQLRYALRFPLSKGQVEVSFQNTGGTEQKATLPVVQESQSFSFSSARTGLPTSTLPVDYQILPSGLGYIQITSFLDNDVLSIQVWERALKEFNENKVPGVIIDMRNNGGGSGWLANQMAAYFFDKETVVGNSANYDEKSGKFYMDPGDEQIMIPPREELRYSGPVAVLVGPACASACEFFSYNMTVNNRATIVGQYPSEGAGGSVEQFLMPENLQVQLTIGRAVDAKGNIHLEGKGVTPTLKVPVTADTLKRQASGEDVVLQAAEDALTKGSGGTAGGTTGGGSTGGSGGTAGGGTTGGGTTAGTPPGTGVTPSGKPKLASESDASKALKAGTDFLEARAREQPSSSDFAKPGKITYTVPLNASEPLIWSYAWCAKDTATLKQNFDNIKLKFMLDGSDVTSQMYTTEAPSNGQQCRLVYTLLNDWPGGEHHLTTTATFSNKINDGTADYAAGDYILDYTVTVKP